MLHLSGSHTWIITHPVVYQGFAVGQGIHLHQIIIYDDPTSIQVHSFLPTFFEIIKLSNRFNNYAKSTLQCFCFSCALLDNCVAFVFDGETQTCYFYMSWITTDDIIVSPGQNYYIRSSYTPCEYCVAFCIHKHGLCQNKK